MPSPHLKSTSLQKMRTLVFCVQRYPVKPGINEKKFSLIDNGAYFLIR